MKSDESSERREEAESTALEKAARYLEKTRRFPTA